MVYLLRCMGLKCIFIAKIPVFELGKKSKSFALLLCSTVYHGNNGANPLIVSHVKYGPWEVQNSEFWLTTPTHTDHVLSVHACTQIKKHYKSRSRLWHVLSVHACTSLLK